MNALVREGLIVTDGREVLLADIGGLRAAADA
ncbi:hypothetical protein BH23CHL8_BH23CHL8_25340 [soil metagenome]